jgi:hypothetical protein
MPDLKSLAIGSVAVAVSDFGVATRFAPVSLDVAGLPLRAIADGALGAYAGAMLAGRAKPDIVASLVQGFAATFAANAFGGMLPLPAVGPFNLGRIAAGAAAGYGVEALFGKDAIPG